MSNAPNRQTLLNQKLSTLSIDDRGEIFDCSVNKVLYKKKNPNDSTDLYLQIFFKIHFNIKSVHRFELEIRSIRTVYESG